MIRKKKGAKRHAEEKDGEKKESKYRAGTPMGMEPLRASRCLARWCAKDRRVAAGCTPREQETLLVTEVIAGVYRLGQDVSTHVLSAFVKIKVRSACHWRSMARRAAAKRCCRDTFSMRAPCVTAEASSSRGVGAVLPMPSSF